VRERGEHSTARIRIRESIQTTKKADPKKQV
jgi:hypothetical protein